MRCVHRIIPNRNCGTNSAINMDLYIIDEANVESHGMGYGPESLAKDATWKEAHLLPHTQYVRTRQKPTFV